MFCPKCKKFLQPPRTWIRAELESKELLTFCIKRLKNLSKVRLVNAEFVWTEPHSKRIKLKLNVQKEVLNGEKLEQAYIAEYVVTDADHMCESCSRVQANPNQWVAAVQLWQHFSHGRSFFYLEQLILKHDAHVRAIKIKQMDEGIDFFFSSQSHALKFLEFVRKVVPTKSCTDKQLVSHDTKSNDYNYKHTFSVEICPVCREDLVCLPPKVAVGLGNFGPLVLCAKVIAFIQAACGIYIVLDVESVSSEVNVGGSKYALADVQVACVSDFGNVYAYDFAAENWLGPIEGLDIDSFSDCGCVIHLGNGSMFVMWVENPFGNKELVFRDNKLMKMPAVSIFESLLVFDVSYNEIPSLNGVSKVSSTLKELYVSKNEVTKMEELDHLYNLHVLELGSN
ncbi:hypothetical protein IFM89_021240 [Coptis chinensis]|uniref:60S ribosomal export protein NMD3 n=1 Tax=Coptis chinensis TaxID=261450 RepID=A0A835H0D1_9MAGN|nr:hypothetical protein IFM89_021240 [Coptis chinensis]